MTGSKLWIDSLAKGRVGSEKDFSCPTGFANPFVMVSSGGPNLNVNACTL